MSELDTFAGSELRKAENSIGLSVLAKVYNHFGEKRAGAAEKIKRVIENPNPAYAIEDSDVRTYNEQRYNQILVLKHVRDQFYGADFGRFQEMVGDKKDE
ncbi:MAG: hypothetical protein ABH864_05610 [archaeon]